MTRKSISLKMKVNIHIINMQIIERLGGGGGGEKERVVRIIVLLGDILDLHHNVPLAQFISVYSVLSLYFLSFQNMELHDMFTYTAILKFFVNHCHFSFIQPGLSYLGTARDGFRFAYIVFMD